MPHSFQQLADKCGNIFIDNVWACLIALARLMFTLCELGSTYMVLPTKR
jgi:hypothetical protein